MENQLVQFTPTDPVKILQAMDDEEKNNQLLQWELEWVDLNHERYASAWHRAAVKGNIIKLYKIRRLEQALKALQQ